MKAIHGRRRRDRMEKSDNNKVKDEEPVELQEQQNQLQFKNERQEVSEFYAKFIFDKLIIFHAQRLLYNLQIPLHHTLFS